MRRKIISIDRHRNGVHGVPFDIVLFRDEDGSTMVAVLFEPADFNPRVAVLQVDKLAKGDIAFGSNSWRGDTYAEFLTTEISKRDATRA